MAAFRGDLLRQAEQRGEPPVAELREELEQLDPLGLWREAARGYLSVYGFVQSETECFAATMARALGINTDELRVCIAENRIGTALLIGCFPTLSLVSTEDIFPITALAVP